MRSLVVVTIVLIAVALIVFVAEFTGAQAANHIGVALTDFKVSMTSTNIPAGVPVTFEATNQGQTMHEVVLEKAGEVDQPLEINGSATEIQDIAPGETKSAAWTITEPGVYQIGCHVPGHFEAGMVEQFTVVDANGSAQLQIAAPARLPPPSAANGGHGGSRAAAGSGMLMLSALPSSLGVAGPSLGTTALWWLAAAFAGGIAAAYVAFRFIIRQIRVEE